ncbi:MAG: phosphatidate cytidylyltransferase [Kiloniellaceae bacterium]
MARILSALVLAPPVLAALYLGPPYSDAMVMLAGGVLAWEWARLCARGSFDLTGGVMMFAVLAVIAAGILGGYSVAGWLLAAGAMATVVTATRRRQAESLWSGLGVVYIGAACLGFLWLRQDPDIGRPVVFWLVAVVWATDIGAYFAGRGLGGPRLAPSISPNKTWSGVAGGVLAAILVGLAAAAWRGQGNALGLAAMSAVLAIVAQAGDLFESSLKRRFGVKDASDLIPGHGGLLDRADGVLAGSLILAALTLLVETPI